MGFDNISLIGNPADLDQNLILEGLFSGSNVKQCVRKKADNCGAMPPRANEILVAVAVADSGRPLPRVGGLVHEDVVGEDGLR